MNVTYTIPQISEAGRDVLEIYSLAEERLKKSCIPHDLIQLRNAFQVFRYAFREWALTKEEGVVLRALMFRDNSVGEVKRILGMEEIIIECEDEDVGNALAKLLGRNGYEEESIRDD